MSLPSNVSWAEFAIVIVASLAAVTFFTLLVQYWSTAIWHRRAVRTAKEALREFEKTYALYEQATRGDLLNPKLPSDSFRRLSALNHAVSENLLLILPAGYIGNKESIQSAERKLSHVCSLATQLQIELRQCISSSP